MTKEPRKPVHVSMTLSTMERLKLLGGTMTNGLELASFVSLDSLAELQKKRKAHVEKAHWHP